MDEFFFIMYHMKQSYSEVKKMPVYERKHFINMFIEQKTKENEAIESMRKNKK